MTLNPYLSEKFTNFDITMESGIEAIIKCLYETLQAYIQYSYKDQRDTSLIVAASKIMNAFDAICDVNEYQ